MTEITQTAFYQNLRSTWDLFKHNSGVLEVRALLKSPGKSNAWEGWGEIISGYFDSYDAFAERVTALERSKQATGVYVTLNPVMHALLGRAKNRLIAAGKKAPTTSDGDIVSRRALLIDADPYRPAGLSSTQAEMDAAIAKADEVAAYLYSMGFPSFYQANSGNGAHLVGRIDLPNDAASDKLIGDFLECLNWKFGAVPSDKDEKTRQFNQGIINVGIDTTVKNASRITKLYGTAVRKGDDTDDRPHRDAAFTDTPDQVTVIPAELIEVVAQEYRDHKAAQSKPLTFSVNGKGHKPAADWSSTADSFERWMAEHGVTLGDRDTYTNNGWSYKWSVDCLTSGGAHKDGAEVFWGVEKLGYKCHHDSCNGKDWNAVRSLIAPKSSTNGRDDYEGFSPDAPALPSDSSPGNVKLVADMLRMACDANHPIDDLKPMVRRLTEAERNSEEILAQLCRALPSEKERAKWLRSCGHIGDSKAETWLAALQGLSYQFSLNQLEDDVEVNGQRLDDVTRSKIYLEMEKSQAPRAYVDDAVNVLASENTYHPIRDYLLGLKWDGQNHIGKLLEHLHGDIFVTDKSGNLVTDKYGKKVALHHLLIGRWLLGCVARGLEGASGSAFKHQTPMLVIVGRQGLGKSSFVRWLSDGVGRDYHRESPLNPHSIDDQRCMVTKWLWEVSELGSSLRKADRDALKGFITQEWHTYRKPWGRAPITKPTLCNLVGSLNKEVGFLDDPTGHRRFLPVSITGIDHGYKNAVDVNQLWAQIVAMYQGGESPELSILEKEALAKTFEDHEIENPLQTYLHMYFDIVPGDETKKCFTADIILRLQAFGITLKGDAKAAGRDINDALAPMGLERKKISVDGIKQMGWVGIEPNTKAPPTHKPYNGW